MDQNVDSIDDSSSEFKIFGSEIRSSFGWDSSPNLYTGFWGRIGVSSYVTKTQGQMVFSMLLQGVRQML